MTTASFSASSFNPEPVATAAGASARVLATSAVAAGSGLNEKHSATARMWR